MADKAIPEDVINLANRLDATTDAVAVAFVEAAMLGSVTERLTAAFADYADAIRDAASMAESYRVRAAAESALRRPGARYNRILSEALTGAIELSLRRVVDAAVIDLPTASAPTDAPAPWLTRCLIDLTYVTGVDSTLVSGWVDRAIAVAPKPTSSLTIRDERFMTRLKTQGDISDRPWLLEQYRQWTLSRRAWRPRHDQTAAVLRTNPAAAVRDVPPAVVDAIAIVGAVLATAPRDRELLVVIHHDDRHHVAEPIYCVAGDERSVSSDALAKQAKGNWIVHSHPAHFGLSADDILAAAQSGAAGIVAVSGDSVFVAVRDPALRRGSPDQVVAACAKMTLERNAMIRDAHPDYPSPAGGPAGPRVRTMDAAQIAAVGVDMRQQLTEPLANLLGYRLVSVDLAPPVVRSGMAPLGG